MKRRLSLWAIVGGTASFASAPLGSHHAQAAEAVNHLKDVKVQAPSESDGTASETEVLIVATASPRYSARLADGGKRLLIDISDADVSGAPAALDAAKGLVGGVLTQDFHQGGSATARVAVTLREAVSYRIRPEGSVLHVLLLPRDANPGAAPDSSSPQGGQTAAPKAQESATLAQVQDVKFSHGPTGDIVRIELAAPVAYGISLNDTARPRLELRGARLPHELERTLDVTQSAKNLRTVSSFRESDHVVIEAERVGNAVGVVRREGNHLLWIFAKPGEVASSETGVGPDGGAARRTHMVSREPDLLETTSAPSEAGAAGSIFQPGGGGHFTGRRIDLDLKDADIHNVLRLLAEVGKVNVITADNVSGSVTIRMRNVPWDQALDVVLQSKNLGMIHQGNMIRVAPLADLEKEREMAIARRKQELELSPVETRLVPVSYAQAAEIQQRAKEMLSPRGSISVDERTNMLIARDVTGNLNQLEELIRSLDTQTPQVLVEARIVEATSRYLRDVGIQWGGDATFSPATGNPTGLAFPSSVGLAGGASDPQAPTAGLSPFDRTVANPNFAVNLPATVGTGTGGAIGLTFGSINNTVNLGIRLSAAESSGMLRIISSPRILTMDNKDARISQGTLIPFAQISAQGVQTTFQEAKLQLLVRPHVTADGSVAMHVKVNRDEPDFNQTSPRGDPTILKREAETDLLVMDGHTAVIGGIFTRNTGRNLDQVPFFGDIPLLGLLFQRRRASDTRGELVIFLTPRIVNRAAALGH